MNKSFLKNLIRETVKEAIDAEKKYSQLKKIAQSGKGERIGDKFVAPSDARLIVTSLGNMSKSKRNRVLSWPVPKIVGRASRLPTMTEGRTNNSR